MRLLLITFVLFSFNSFAHLTGKVMAIADGDTFTLLTADKKQIKIRLYGIDCPEKSQDFGIVAKKFLSDMIFNKQVAVEEKDIDRYGRTIGMVTIDKVNVNEALLSTGLA